MGGVSCLLERTSTELCTAVVSVPVPNYAILKLIWSGILKGRNTAINSDTVDSRLTFTWRRDTRRWHPGAVGDEQRYAYRSLKEIPVSQLLSQRPYVQMFEYGYCMDSGRIECLPGQERGLFLDRND